MPNQKRGFTIVELLVVMSIIMLLMGILAPATNMLRRYAKNTAQQVQFIDIRKGLDMFEMDFNYYPDSGARDVNNMDYCGAMKLAESLLGRDGHGFHPSSKFTADDGTGVNELYPVIAPSPITQAYRANLGKRTTYLENKDLRYYRINNVYTNYAPFDKDSAVISDVFRTLVDKSTDQRVGMPILYYRYISGNIGCDEKIPTDPGNIYNYLDNYELIKLRVPNNPGIIHPLEMEDIAGAIPGAKFYKDILDKTSNIPLPHNKDSYILISAGHDGLYGTKDDVHNF